MIDKQIIADKFKSIQASICQSLEELDGKSKFKSDVWERPGGGGGFSKVIENGNIIEKGGVNFSAVEGELPEAIQKALKVEQKDFFATGVSIVLHAKNPFHPIIHMNIRYFELGDGTFWFGGGIDLTPIYIDADESKIFHTEMKKVCDNFKPDAYENYKKWADDYFFIKHRDETRGIGGIFFDRLNNKQGFNQEELFDFACSVGNSFAPTYTSIINNKGISPVFTESNKTWQYVRRGRYVEFNLVYDKGTKFGLDTNGRIESILMSLPPQANWVYDFKPATGSAEQNTLDLLKKGINWI